jgi:lysophospholipase L1-like esterase
MKNKEANRNELRFGNVIDQPDKADLDKDVCTMCHPRKISATICAPLTGVLVLLCAFCFPFAAAGQSGSEETPILPDNPKLQIVGRYDGRDASHPRFGFPGGGVIFRFKGTAASLDVSIDSDKGALSVVVDHGAPAMHLLKKGDNIVVLASQLDDAAHTVEVYKRTETVQGVLTIHSIRLGEGGSLLDPPGLPVRRLMFVGDSVTCGAGVNNNAVCKPDPLSPANDAYNAYGLVLGRRLDAQSHLVCYGGRGLERDYRGLGAEKGVLNAPQFIDLAVATDAPASRAAWDASRWQPDAIVVSLGTNDFNLQKTLPLNPKKWVDEYVAFVRTLRKEYPRASILLTEGAMVTDPLLRQMVQDTVARMHTNRVRYLAATHYPGNGCNGHPTRAQHLRIADDMEPELRRVLGW